MDGEGLVNNIWIIQVDGVIRNRKRMIIVEKFASGLIVFAIYSFFALRWGIRAVDGRWQWLEQPNHKAIKIVIGAIFGYILAAFYFIFWCVKMLTVTLPKWLS